MESSVFETINKEPKEKKLTISIPVELDKLITSVTSELKVKAPHLRFNPTAVCVNALNKAIKKAQRELEKMDKPKKKSSSDMSDSLLKQLDGL